MTDREKIIKIIEKNGTYNGKSLSFDYYVVRPDDLADALIENGIGDIIEWKRRAEVAEKKFELLYAEASNSIILPTKEKYKEQAEKEIEEERK